MAARHGNMVAVLCMDKVTELSEIPCRLIVGAHEGLTSPPLSLPRTRRIYLPGAKAWDSHRVAETPWSFTAACRCVVI